MVGVADMRDPVDAGAQSYRRGPLTIDLSQFNPDHPDALDREVLSRVGELAPGSTVEVLVGSRPPARTAISWLIFHGHRQLVRVIASDPITEALWAEAMAFAEI